jgi:hypothetical protein
MILSMADRKHGAIRPRDELTLLGDEAVIRTDPAHVSADLRDNMLTGGYLFGQLAVMLLTDRRVAFLPPDLGLTFMLKANLYEGLGDIWPTDEHVARALGKIRTYDFAEIVRFWSWQPEFSAPPAIQVGPTELVAFGLQIDEYPWGRQASLDAIREHFAAVTAAWSAARADLSSQSKS